MNRNNLFEVQKFLPKVLQRVLVVENTQQRHSKFFAQMEDQQRRKNQMGLFFISEDFADSIFIGKLIFFVFIIKSFAFRKT